MMKLKKNKIVYLPYPIKREQRNEYVSNMIDILKEDYEVVGEIISSTGIFGMIRTKAVFLNWTESQLDKQMKQQLLLYKLFGAKIIWIFHNKQPHEIDDAEKINANMKWLANHCDVIILHSKGSKKYIPNRKRNAKKAVYVPHIMYDDNDMLDTNDRDNQLEDVYQNYHICKNDFVFTMFGLIRPYKNIEGGIEAFYQLMKDLNKDFNTKNMKLLIVGKPQSNSYAKMLHNMCKENSNIILDFRFVSNKELDEILSISDVVVLPYKDTSSMNSGVMIKAFSNAKTVIAPDICMARDYHKEGFMYMYRDSLKRVMHKAFRNGKDKNKEMGRMAQSFMLENNNKEIVKECLRNILKQ